MSGRAGTARAAALKRPLVVVMGAEYDILSGVTVTSVSTGASMPLTSAWKKNNGKALVVLLTHFGDLTCWEYAQKLRYYLPQLEAQGVQVRMVGIGGAEAASEFAQSNSIPKELLYYDPDASAAAALGLNPGFGRKSGGP